MQFITNKQVQLSSILSNDEDDMSKNLNWIPNVSRAGAWAGNSELGHSLISQLTCGVGWVAVLGFVALLISSRPPVVFYQGYNTQTSLINYIDGRIRRSASFFVCYTPESQMYTEGTKNWKHMIYSHFLSEFERLDTLLSFYISSISMFKRCVQLS